MGFYASMIFFRLYGLFPCNFLSYLRTQYSDNNKDNRSVFVHTIRPMLATVRMHPLLVTHSRDQEKASARFKRLEVHDIVAESSRYSLMSQESTMEDREPPALDVGAYASVFKGQQPSVAAGEAMLNADIHHLCAAMAQDPLWTPSRKVGLITPPPAAATSSSTAGASQSHVEEAVTAATVTTTMTTSTSGTSISKLMILVKDD